MYRIHTSPMPMKILVSLLLVALSNFAVAEIVTVDGRTCDIQRDQHGRILRSKKAVAAFRAAVPCPGSGETGKSCLGYIVDHVQALCSCGADDPSNMQYQTLADSKIKDRWERKLCQGKLD
jgi:hypothetical protein